LSSYGATIRRTREKVVFLMKVVNSLVWSTRL
jgi:hypothetical protein